MICLFFHFPIPPFFRSPEEFKTNTYTHNFRSKLDEMIQSAFRLLQTRIKNRMAFTQIEWILAIRNQSLAICVPQDVCTSDISQHVQNAICFYKYKHVCSHVYFCPLLSCSSNLCRNFFLSSHWLQTWNNVFDQFFTQIAIRKYLNYDLPFLPFSDPSRFPTSGPRARRHKFKTNTYTDLRNTRT